MPSFPKRAAAKYGNTRVGECSYGFSHRSKLEAAVCNLIWLREKAGEIEHLQHEFHVYMTIARVAYVADFRVRDRKSGEEILIEAKGYASPVWPLKKRLYKFYGPAPLEIWTGTHTRPTLSETIVPRSTNPKTENEDEHF